MIRMDKLLDAWRADPRPEATVEFCAMLTRASLKPGGSSAMPRAFIGTFAMEALQKTPEDIAVLYALGTLFVALGELREAKDLLEVAEKTSPRDPKTIELRKRVEGQRATRELVSDAPPPRRITRELKLESGTKRGSSPSVAPTERPQSVPPSAEKPHDYETLDAPTTPLDPPTEPGDPPTKTQVTAPPSFSAEHPRRTATSHGMPPPPLVVTPPPPPPTVPQDGIPGRRQTMIGGLAGFGFGPPPPAGSDDVPTKVPANLRGSISDDVPTKVPANLRGSISDDMPTKGPTNLRESTVDDDAPTRPPRTADLRPPSSAIPPGPESPRPAARRAKPPRGASADDPIMKNALARRVKWRATGETDEDEGPPTNAEHEVPTKVTNIAEELRKAKPLEAPSPRTDEDPEGEMPTRARPLLALARPAPAPPRAPPPRPVAPPAHPIDEMTTNVSEDAPTRNIALSRPPPPPDEDRDEFNIPTEVQGKPESASVSEVVTSIWNSVGVGPPPTPDKAEAWLKERASQLRKQSAIPPPLPTTSSKLPPPPALNASQELPRAMAPPRSPSMVGPLEERTDESMDTNIRALAPPFVEAKGTKPASSEVPRTFIMSPEQSFAAGRINPTGEHLLPKSSTEPRTYIMNPNESVAAGRIDPLGASGGFVGGSRQDVPLLYADPSSDSILSARAFRSGGSLPPAPTFGPPPTFGPAPNRSSPPGMGSSPPVTFGAPPPLPASSPPGFGVPEFMPRDGGHPPPPEATSAVPFELDYGAFADVAPPIDHLMTSGTFPASQVDFPALAAAQNEPDYGPPPRPRGRSPVLPIALGLAALMVLSLVGYAAFLLVQDRRTEANAAAAGVPPDLEQAILSGSPGDLTRAEIGLDGLKASTSEDVVRARAHALIVKSLEVTGKDEGLEALANELRGKGLASDAAAASAARALIANDKRALEALEADPDASIQKNAFYQYVIGISLESVGDPGAARRYELALLAEPQLLLAEMRLTRLHLLDVNLEEADKHLVKLADGSPSKRALTVLRAVVAGLEGKSTEKLGDLPPTVELQRALLPTYAAAKIAADPKHNDVRALSERAVAEADSPALAYLFGRLALARGDAGGAIAAAQRALTLGPKFGPAIRLLTRAVVRAGRFEEALAVTAKLPDDVTRELRAISAYEAGDVDALAAISAKLAESDPEKANVKARLDRLRGRPLAEDRIAALLLLPDTGGDLCAVDALLDVGNLERARTIIKGWSDPAEHPLRSRRYARLLRYDGNFDEAALAISGTSKSPASYLEQVLLEAELPRGRDRAIVALSSGTSPLGMGPSAKFLEVYVRARNKENKVAAQILETMEVPSDQAALPVRLVAGLAFAEIRDKRGERLVQQLYEVFPRNRDVVRAAIAFDLADKDDLDPKK